MPQINFSDLTELTGSLGIGSIAVLAVVLVLDATTPFYSLVEANSESNSWAIFVALPLLVISYVAGVICVAIGNTTRHRMIGASRQPIYWTEIPEHLLSLVVVEYRNVRRKIDVLDGAVPAFLLLAIGVVFEAVNFRVYLLGAILFLVTVLCAAICALVAIRTEREFLGFLDRTRVK